MNRRGCRYNENGISSARSVLNTAECDRFTSRGKKWGWMPVGATVWQPIGYVAAPAGVRVSHRSAETRPCSPHYHEGHVRHCSHHLDHSAILLIHRRILKSPPICVIFTILLKEDTLHHPIIYGIFTISFS